MPPIFFFLGNMFVFFLLFALMLLVFNLFQIRTYGPLFSETNGTFGSKLAIIFSGRRVPRNSVENLKHEDPAEIFEGYWRLHTPILERPLEDEEYEKIEKEAREKAWEDIQASTRTYLWTRPQPPGLVFFVLGYLSLIIFGSPFLAFLG